VGPVLGSTFPPSGVGPTKGIAVSGYVGLVLGSTFPPAGVILPKSRATYGTQGTVVTGTRLVLIR
jgi:hypothetical protein